MLRINRRQVITSALAWVFAAAMAGMIYWAVRNDHETLQALLSVHPFEALLLMAACLLLYIPTGLGRLVVARRLGVRFEFMDWYGLVLVGNLIGLVIPARGDFILSAVYLKRKYGLSVTHFGSMVYGNVLLWAATLGVEACLALLMLGVTTGAWDPRLWALALALALGTLTVALFPASRLRSRFWLVVRFREVLEGWEMIRADRSLLLSLGLINLSGTLIFALWLYACYWALGFTVGFGQLFFAGVVLQLSFVLTITPANLGLREAVLGAVSQVLGLGFAQGVAVSLLQRAVSVAAFVVFGGLFSLLILPGLSRVFQPQVPE